MKQLIVICTIVLLFAGSASTQPRIEIVEGMHLELGDVYRGDAIEKKVTVRNTGPEALVIDRVDAACGCTGTLLSEKTIPPGKTGTLLIKFDSKNFSGKVHKTVTVVSNAANTPQATIMFTANVVEDLTIAPTYFWFRDAMVGTAANATITIKNGSTQPLKLTGFRSEMEGFNLKLPEKPIEPGQSVDVIAELRPKTVQPVLHNGVYLMTSSLKQPEVYIQIFGNVKEFRFD
jgi:hypothetical protein